MVFKEIDDNLWDLIKPFMPAQRAWTGRPRCDLRKTFNGILYVQRTGINWSDVPRMYGSKSTVHKLHLELCRTGAYQKINDILLSMGTNKDKIDLSCCNIDTKDVIAKKGKYRIRRQ